MIFTLIQIKFYIDINDDELLEMVKEHKKRKKMIIISGVQQHKAPS
jgi:hypothetical protein